jgi:hypothetical protein
MKFHSQTRHVLVTWQDRQTSELHTVDMWVTPQAGADAIQLTCAADVLSARQVDVDRVEVLNVTDL